MPELLTCPLIAPASHPVYDYWMLAAIILAAGDSIRMGAPKALLATPDGRPFVTRIVRAMAAANVGVVVVVTGNQHDAIVQALAADRPPLVPVVVRNPEPSRGQLSSLWVGLDATETPDLSGVLVTPVDMPMVRASTIRRVIEVWEKTHAPVVRPAVGMRHGHPVLFAREVFDALRHASLAEGARVVIRANADRVVNVQVDDAGCVVDVDTPADYETLLTRSGER